jgi:hypothetical protein
VTAGKRHSVRYFPSRERSSPTGHAFLLARDIPLGIMPIRATRDRQSFRVELSTQADEEGEKWLIHFLHIGQYEQRTLEEALVDFVDKAAHHIGYFGEVYFEILVDIEKKPMRLDPLPPGRVLRAPSRYLQVVPKVDREQLHVGRFVAIPAERIWRLALPRRLGGPRGHRRLLRRLQALSDPTMPRFALESPDLGRASGYDFTAYRDASERLEERATRRWGTLLSVQRPVGPSTEYFFIARRLAFLHAQAHLREHIIGELNHLLSRLTVPHSVAVSGIPTADEIATALGRLHNGDMTFTEAHVATRT